MHLDDGEEILAAAAESMLSHGLFRQGAYDVARDHAERALKLSRTFPKSWVTPDAVLAAANCEIDLGFYREAIANYRLSAELAEMLGKQANKYYPQLNIALCLIQLNEFHDAIRLLHKVRDELTHNRVKRLQAFVSQYLGLAHEGLKDFATARGHFQDAANIRRPSAQAPTLYDCIAGLLRTNIALGDLKAARINLDELVIRLTSSGWEGMEEPILVIFSTALGFQGLDLDDEYAKYLTDAHSLMTQRASMLQDPASAESYLNNVPVNRRLGEAFDQMEK